MAEASTLAHKMSLKDHVIKSDKKKLGAEARGTCLMHRRQRQAELSEFGLALSTQ